MELCILDVEGTQEALFLNEETEVKREKALCNLAEVLEHVNLGIEPTIQKVDNSYITTVDNANWYIETYGWIFSKIAISKL